MGTWHLDGSLYLNIIAQCCLRLMRTNKAEKKVSGRGRSEIIPSKPCLITLCSSMWKGVRRAEKRILSSWMETDGQVSERYGQELGWYRGKQGARERKECQIKMNKTKDDERAEARGRNSDETKVLNHPIQFYKSFVNTLWVVYWGSFTQMMLWQRKQESRLRLSPGVKGS